MKVGTGGNLGLSREYHTKLFGPLFYTWWNCPLSVYQTDMYSGAEYSLSIKKAPHTSYNRRVYRF